MSDSDDSIKESLIQNQPNPISLEGMKKIIYHMENCICKIFCQNGSIGTGFFSKITFQDNYYQY